jgi:pyruvate dehydrogenase E2 component (dihydrolipoamide acetyltransferase)
MFDPNGTVAERRREIDRFHRHNCAPTVVIDMDVWIEPAFALVKEINNTAPEGSPKVTLRDAVIKASALALRKNTIYHSAYNGRYMLLPSEGIDIGTPVPDGQSAVVAVVKNADTLSLGEIAAAVGKAVEDLSAGRGRPAERPWHAGRLLLGAAMFAGGGLRRVVRSRLPSLEKRWLESEHKKLGGFMVTDVSEAGVTACHGQLTQPLVSSLTMLAIKDEVSTEKGAIRVRRMLPLALEFDHKLLDAGGSSRFLSEIRGLLESPGALR